MNRQARRLVVTLGSAVWLLVIAHARAAEPEQRNREEVAFVLAVFGEWVLEDMPAHSLKLGQGLPAGGRVRTTEPQTRHTYITIALLNGNEMTRSCEEPDGCSVAIVLPESIGKSRSLGRRIVEAVRKLFAHEPEAYVCPIGRGRGELREAVVELVDGKVDLAQAVSDMGSGRQLYQLTALGGDSSDPFALAIDRNGNAEAPLVRVGPGIYQLQVLDRQRRTPVGIQSWVLVASPARYPELLRRFSEARSLVDDWSPNVRPNVVRSFLRAFLRSLVDENTAPR